MSIVAAPDIKRGGIDLIKKNAEAAITYLSTYVKWKGTLDFVLRWDNGNTLGNYWTSSGPGFAAYGGVNTDGNTYALSESITGIDANGSDYDVGVWISANNDSMTDYGDELYIDPDPNPEVDDLSTGQRDFLSTFLHESLHGLGFWSSAQHGNGIKTSFDLLTREINGKWYFTGAKTQEVYGNILPLALTGSRDHYADTISERNDMMREYGHPEKWQLSNIDLAILHDLGYEIIKWIPAEIEGGHGNLKYSGFYGAHDIALHILGGEFLEIIRTVNLVNTGKSVDISASTWTSKVQLVEVTRTSLNGDRIDASQIDLGKPPQGSVLVGGIGNDQLWGKAGWDILDGGYGDDLIHGGNGRDIITGGAGRDELHGDFGWNTYKSEKDGVSDLIAIKSDQYLSNWIYGKAGNNADGSKCDIIEGLDAVDKIKIIGVDTRDITFAANVTAKGLTGIGIYAKGALEALYTGGDLSINQITQMTSGDGSAAAMANQINSYGVW